MKAPPNRKGNVIHTLPGDTPDLASIKALPKRKGNAGHAAASAVHHECLNESPYEKVGK